MTRRDRLRALAGIALADLRHDRLRTVLAVIGLALAVLSMTTLAGVGTGVMETGSTKLNASNQDLWVVSESTSIAPGSVGGVQGEIDDVRQVSREIEGTQGVRTAFPMGFQTVYVSPNGTAFKSVVGVGVVNGSGINRADRGRPISADYARQSYAAWRNRTRETAPENSSSGANTSAPVVGEVVVSPRTADLFDLSVGDRVYLGGTVAGARSNSFEVVGVSGAFSPFLQTPSVVVTLADLQLMTGTAVQDEATLISVRVTSEAAPGAVADRIEQVHPDMAVRTNQEQLTAVLERQAVVLASGTSLVALAILVGLGTTAAFHIAFVHQRRETLQALRAIGWSSRSLGALVIGRAIVLAVLGGVIGVLATPLVARAANAFVTATVGFSGIVSVTPRILYAGFGIALLTGIVSAILATRLVIGLGPIPDHVR